MLAMGGSAVCCQAAWTEDGYALPVRHHIFEFPRDHGNHPDFKIEWWYFVGHLFDEEGKRYGFQATFFRNRIKPPAESKERDSNFSDAQLYLAHMAFTDPNEKAYYHEERLNREGWDATSSETTLDLRNGNWSLKLEHTESGDEVFQLVASIEGDVYLRLSFKPAKQRIIFGEEGVSVKGDPEEAVSYYITYTRLETAGTVRLNNAAFSVTGSSWMDHEISSNQLGDELEGWDWVCVQLQDGREIKAYRLRTDEGGMSKHSRLIWIDEEGTLTYQSPGEYQWIEDTYWASPQTGGKYPNQITLSTTDPKTQQPFNLKIKPILDNQEMVGKNQGINYWEGACQAINAEGEVVGEAYLELTGYDEALELN